MSHTPPDVWDLAGRIIAYEAPRDGFRIAEHLSSNFAGLMGRTGFHALVQHAHTLAVSEVAWLHELRVREDGTFEGLDDVQVSAREIAEGGVTLLAQLLELLIGFIGESLTLRLLRDAWPELPLDEWDSGSGGRT